MYELHEARYSYSDGRVNLKAKLTDFDFAEDDFDPNCLRGKKWELIKLDFMEFVQNN
jgi:hypothetical protein